MIYLCDALPLWCVILYLCDALPLWCFTFVMLYLCDALPLWCFMLYLYDALPLWCFTFVMLYLFDALPLWCFTFVMLYLFKLLHISLQKRVPILPRLPFEHRKEAVRVRKRGAAVSIGRWTRVATVAKDEGPLRQIVGLANTGWVEVCSVHTLPKIMPAIQWALSRIWCIGQSSKDSRVRGQFSASIALVCTQKQCKQRTWGSTNSFDGETPPSLKASTFESEGTQTWKHQGTHTTKGRGGWLRSTPQMFAKLYHMNWSAIIVGPYTSVKLKKGTGGKASILS